MALTLSAHRYGQEAQAALTEAIDRLKTVGGTRDPLAPVTIVVPSSLAGYHIRRSLGRRPGGIVNVQVKPLKALLELIGSTSLTNAGRRPLPEAYRAETIRSVAERGEPVFGDVPIDGPVLRHLLQRFSEFDDCDQTQLDAIAAQPGVAAYLVGLYRQYLKETAEFYTDRDLTESATAALHDRPVVLRDIGSVIVYLPLEWSSAQKRFLRELSKQTEVKVLLGLTGDLDNVDRHVLDGWNIDDHRDAGSVPVAQEIVQSPDAEEEVRFAIRAIAESLLADQPTPLHQTAILYRQAEPYQRICTEQLDAAGLTWNGRNSETLGQSIAGRTLDGLLGLISEATISWTNDVAPWLSAGPIRSTTGELAATARWNQLARRANLHRDPDEWQGRLARYRATCVADLERLRRVGDESRPGRRPWIETEIREIDELSEFAGQLARFRQQTPSDASWSEYAAMARGRLELLLGDRSAFAGQLAGDDDLQLARWDDVQNLLSELSWLDGLERATPQRFVSAARRGLERRLGHHQRYGDGVYVGPLHSAAGLQWDVVYILGAAEKSLPETRTDDPLLSDELRARASLPVALDHLRAERAGYLVALHSAERRVISYPRADLRAERARLPGRWLLESATELNQGKRIYASKIDRVSGEIVRATPSFERAVLSTGESADIQEFDLRSIRRVERPSDHHLAGPGTPLRRGFVQRFERRQPRLTRWDGLVSGGAGDVLTAPHSAGALQDWATCPYRYFLGRVLGIEERDEPRDELQITALDKGSLVHDTLDQFFEQASTQPDPTWGWTEDERQRLEAIANAKLDEADQNGLTGRALLWRRDRQRMLDDLLTWLDKDDEHRSSAHARQIASELVFGRLPDSQGEVQFILEDGSLLLLRGVIDRVDRSDLDDRLIVIDYKTGAERPRMSELRKDPLVGGRYLQLPIYAHAARQVYGLEPAATVDTAYWYITERGQFRYNTVEWDDDNSARFHDAINLIAENVRAGRFPANPGDGDRRSNEANCTYCSFDAICPIDRSANWKRTRLDPALVGYIELSEGPREEAAQA